MLKKTLVLLVLLVSLFGCITEIHSSYTKSDRIYILRDLRRLEQSEEEKEIKTLAINVYHEARGSNREDMIAVAEVTMNRVRSNRFPNTVEGVVYQNKQFSWTISGRGKRISEKEAYTKCLEIAKKVYYQKKNSVVSNDVYHYVYKDIVDDILWTRGFKYRLLVGSHIYLS